MPAYLYIAYLEPENLALNLKRSNSLNIRKVYTYLGRYAHMCTSHCIPNGKVIYHHFLQVGLIDSCLIKVFKMSWGESVVLIFLTKLWTAEDCNQKCWCLWDNTIYSRRVLVLRFCCSRCSDPYSTPRGNSITIGTPFPRQADRNSILGQVLVQVLVRIGRTRDY